MLPRTRSREHQSAERLLIHNIRVPLYRFPDMTAQVDLFIRVCLQNQGKLSKTKRLSVSRMLKDDEIAQLEQCVSDGY